MDHSDGVGAGWQIILVTYLRLFCHNTPGIVGATTSAFFLITPTKFASTHTLGFVLITMVMHSAAWWAVYTLVVSMFPKRPQRFCQLVSSLAGFSSGFLITRSQMPSFLNFLFFINPVFWAFSAIVRHITEERQLFCKETSPLDCQDKLANHLLEEFGLANYHPLTSLFIFLVIVFGCLFLASIVLEIKASNGFAATLKQSVERLKQQTSVELQEINNKNNVTVS